MLKAILVFLVLFMSITVNLPESFLGRIGVDANYVMAGLVAVVLTGMTTHKNTLLTILVVACCLLANMPETVASWGLDSDYFFGVLIALVVTPIGAKMSGRF